MFWKGASTSSLLTPDEPHVSCLQLSSLLALPNTAGPSRGSNVHHCLNWEILSPGAIRGFPAASASRHLQPTFSRPPPSRQSW